MPTSDIKAISWLHEILKSIKDLITTEPNTESEDDAVAGWIGTRKGRGRCRSVGEVH